MEYKVFQSFVKSKDVPRDLVNKYRGKLPDKLINIWENYGFGSILDSYIKIINPDEYMDLLKRSYFRANEAIPIMVTGFADIITWEKNRYIGLVKYRKGTFEIIEDGFNYFFNDILDSEYAKDCLDNTQYAEAIEKNGYIEYDECFGYVPLLGLGGPEKVENLKKVKIKEHIEIITQLVGRIG
jgi:hypothetical protein